MSAVYDNWERLVTAALRREQLRQAALRTPSDLSSVSSSPSPSPSFQLGAHYGKVGASFTHGQLLEATGSFTDSKLIKHGHSGELYFGVLESGTEVVVKKVSVPSSDHKGLCFISEMEISGMLNNPRLLPFLGHCLEDAHDKFLVYKYMRNKDLSYFLSGKIDQDRQSMPSLDWTTRLKIATGAAEGLCYLHHECFPPLVHRYYNTKSCVFNLVPKHWAEGIYKLGSLCDTNNLACFSERDIQASSILLDDEFAVRLGSLTSVWFEEKDNHQNRIARFLRLPRVSEQSSSSASNATCAYDVYCFGKVLLELITGKLAVNESGMKDWMANTLRCIVPYDKKLITNIVDSSLILDEPLMVQVWAVAFVAKACLSPKPSKRPKMAQILKALEHTTLERFAGTGLKLGGIPNGEILSHPNLRIFTFLELKDATKNFAMESWLGQDEFGRVYRGLLHGTLISSSGGVSVIAVKRMNLKVAQGFQAELVGRLSHPNILSPLGYCSEDDELLLVYEFMQEGSLKNFLSRSGSALQPLPWERRLKILVGAAKGLAFLHATERRCFFRQKKERGGFFGYLKSSKILIDSDYNAKITGFGVADVNPPEDVHEVHPLKLTSRADEYAAPEFKKEGSLVLESDVYGFGVVLVRVLTGTEHYHPLELTDVGPQKFMEEEMDPRLEGKYPWEAALRMAQLACFCLQQDLKLRPAMKRVALILEDIEKKLG